jgi:hypothetical protein
LTCLNQSLPLIIGQPARIGYAVSKPGWGRLRASLYDGDELLRDAYVHSHGASWYFQALTDTAEDDASG